ncbi:FecR family protein [Flavihumibacter sp. UBA7668]|uniref:FecR family protein n=1 Tax=Flavihumibacter sp. UBA7668 TaxID=1946542 RepID=UPI0025BA2EEC|nr:FecR domain-containing protein [Flavihumibacter sp. UBA7668]
MKDLQEQFWQDYQSGKRHLSKEQSADILNKLHGKIGFTSDRKIIHLKGSLLTCVIAAAILGLLLSISWLRKSPESQDQLSENLLPDLESVGMIWHTNVSDTNRNIRLSDGTLVSLHPGSLLRMHSRFSVDRRPVWLQGTAIFSVVKDSTRPFQVISRDWVTTALGTSFLVDGNDPSLLRIKLMEGRVVIHENRSLNNKKPVYLLPGEVFEYNQTQKKITHIIPKPANSHRKDIPTIDQIKLPTKPTPGELVFVQQNLGEVLKQLSTYYNVRFLYQQNELDSLEFTGTLTLTSNLADLLNILAAVNGVRFEKTKQGILVNAEK